jgi:hypothetical protein
MLRRGNALPCASEHDRLGSEGHFASGPHGPLRGGLSCASVGQLSAEQRKVLAGLINPMMPTLNQLFGKLLAIPGVSEVLKPTIDALRAKLAVLTA